MGIKPNWRVINEERDILGEFRYYLSAKEYITRVRLSMHDKMRIIKIEDGSG